MNKDKNMFMSQLIQDKLQRVQKQLNLLCSQHDSLMPLLQIMSYQSTINKWEATVKSMNKKIGQCQKKIDKIMSGEQQINNDDKDNHLYSQNQIISRIKNNIQEIQNKLDPQINPNPNSNSNSNPKILIQQLYNQPTNKNKKKIKKIQHIYQQQIIDDKCSQCIEQLKRYSQSCLAIFRNQLIFAQISQQTKLQQSRTLSQYSNGHNQTIQKFTDEIFHNMQKQVQWIKNGGVVQQHTLVVVQQHTDNPYYTLSKYKHTLNNNRGDGGQNKFYQFTKLRINQEIQQFQIIYGYLAKEKQKRIIKKQVEIVKNRVKMVIWQIKGLVKKYYKMCIKSTNTQNMKNYDQKIHNFVQLETRTSALYNQFQQLS